MRRRRPGRDEGAALARRDREGRDYDDRRHPGRLARPRPPRVARPADRDARRERRRDDGALPRGHRAHRGAAHRRHPPGHLASKVNPVRHRLGVQEQGRPAHARRGRRLPPVAARRRRDRGPRRGRGGRDPAREPDKDEPFSALAFKIPTRPAPGQAHLHPGSTPARSTTGSQVLNSTKDRKERIGKIYQMHANKREERATATRRAHRRGAWV